MPRQNLAEQNVFKRLRALLGELDAEDKPTTTAEMAARLRETIGCFAEEDQGRES
jgi:hypothetical protein